MPIRCRALSVCALLAGALLADATTSRANVALRASPLIVNIPDQTCDVVITPENASTTLGLLNDTAYRVFCIDPGDYRSFGGRIIRTSGSESAPRFLRFDGPGSTKAFQRAEQAIVERLEIGRAHV